MPQSRAPGATDAGASAKVPPGSGSSRDTQFPSAAADAGISGTDVTGAPARSGVSEGGGYEQRLCRYSFLEVGAGEAIRDASLDLLREAWAAVPAAAPTWEPVPVGRPWDAGWAHGGD